WPLRPPLIREARFPYLDRDLREFIYAIPQEQLVGVGRRRFLMRRALVGIVPEELLNRKPKAFFPGGQSKVLLPEWANLATADAVQDMVSGSLEIIDSSRFWHALQKGVDKEGVSTASVMRTLTLEAWLRHLVGHNVLTTPNLAPRK